MSSFIGHGLAALTIGKVFEAKTSFKHKLIWQFFLILCAFAPDIDYLIPSLNSINNGGLRITHSIAFSLILPIFGTVYLSLFDRKNLYWGGFQACLAGLSHLLLDLLVGSKQGDPVLFPFWNSAIGLHFGVLPSAGKISLSNYYFWRNLLIESGILIPIFIMSLYLAGKIILNKIVPISLVIIFLICLVWSINLSR